jgi:hypothetical protein
METSADENSKYARIAISLLIGLVVGGYLLAPRTTSFYRSARDVSTNSTPWRGYIEISGRSRPLFKESPELIVSNATIYLLVRKTVSLPIFSALIKKEDKNWNVTELKTLSTNHPELKQFWPAPDANNLGVEWIAPFD